MTLHMETQAGFSWESSELTGEELPNAVFPHVFGESRVLNAAQFAEEQLLSAVKFDMFGEERSLTLLPHSTHKCLRS